MNFLEIYEKIYGSWLGKLIGIRLGAPIEGWTGPEVRATYAPVRGYVTDYGQFAADDDSNGPLFFVRVMEDHTLDNVTAEAMGDNLLNVVSALHGFFWWGGPGIATEHTAWDNLMKGIKAPQSGSAVQNTQAIAEQIGGQIFSDCWGYISLGNIQEAADLAAMMSSVTHDMDGIEGGKFVAACIAAAWNDPDIYSVIEKGLSALDPESGYYKTMREVIDFYHAHPEDPDACIAWIESTHGYDKYPGVCHILPNSAIMMYGMLYGKGGFDRTMGLIADAGCDTDCNLGNVGSIMGMLRGAAGIDEKWIRPMQDILLSSSSIGADNITEISSSALYFTRIACVLHGIPVPAEYEKKPGQYKADFLMPYAVSGFIPDTDRYHACTLRTVHDTLRICLDDIQPHSPFMIRKKTYFRPEDAYDCRYEPQFAAVLEPGDIVTYEMADPYETGALVTPYVKDYAGNYFFGETIREGTVTMKVPFCRIPVLETGLQIELPVLTRRTSIELLSFSFEKHPAYTVTFADLHDEDRGLDIGSVRHHTVSGLNLYKGDAEITETGLLLKPESAFNLSCRDITLQKVSLETQFPEDLILAYSWRGCRDYSGLRIKEGRLYHIHKKNDSLEETFICDLSHESCLILQADIGKGLVEVQDRTVPVTFSKEKGAVGILNESAAPVVLNQLEILG